MHYRFVKLRAAAVGCVGILAMMAVPGWAASSGEAVVRDAINSMQALSATTGHPQAQRKLLDSIDNALALDLLAKQALGAQWNKMSAAEHRRFIAVFTEALEKLAFPRAAAALSQFKVSYLGADGTASTELVRTTISNGDGGKVPLDFNLERRGTRWQIVDVSMDGGSLSKVVSTRIQNAVQEEGYQKLLEDLQKQVALSDAHS